MKVHRSIQSFHEESISNPVITFGSFDGVHLGHTSIFRQMHEIADQISGQTVVTTFHPHPRKVIYPGDKSMKLLTTIEEKIELFRKCGIDHLVIIPFSIEFSQMLPEEYVESFIIRHYRPHSIIIGYDHRFGLNRAGDINTLKSFAAEGNYEVIEIGQKKINSLKISSTAIRKALKQADVQKANKLLGYPYQIRGKVIHGEKIGEKIGFRTANIEVNDPDKLIPGEGIYAVLVRYGNEEYKGMMYIGTKPTLRREGLLSVEVHLFDFNRDVYSEEIVVQFIDFIRKDATFGSLQELTENMQTDKEKALKILENVDTTEKLHLNT